MKRSAQAICIVIAASLLLLSSCRSSLTREAENVARQCYEAFYVECGDSVYSTGGSPGRHVIGCSYTVTCPDGTTKEFVAKEGTGATQWKEFNVTARASSLTQADRANGMEWKGEISVDCSIQRHFDGARWGSWEDCTKHSAFQLKKVDGEWLRRSITGRWKPLDCPVTEFTCADVPHDICNDVSQ